MAEMQVTKEIVSCVQVPSVLNIPHRLYWSTNDLSWCNIPFHFQRMIPALLLSPDMFPLALGDTILFSLVSTLYFTHALCTCTTHTQKPSFSQKFKHPIAMCCWLSFYICCCYGFVGFPISAIGIVLLIGLMSYDAWAHCIQLVR